MGFLLSYGRLYYRVRPQVNEHSYDRLRTATEARLGKPGYGNHVAFSAAQRLANGVGVHHAGRAAVAVFPQHSHCLQRLQAEDDFGLGLISPRTLTCLQPANAKRTRGGVPSGPGCRDTVWLGNKRFGEEWRGNVGYNGRWRALR